MLNGLKVQVGGHYTNSGANLGYLHGFAKTPSGISHLFAGFCAQYKNAAGHEVGTNMFCDTQKKSVFIETAARLNLGDHNLAMKVNNGGVAQFLFGWKQNSAVDAQVGTKVNLKDFAGSRLSSFPLSMQFNMKY